MKAESKTAMKSVWLFNLVLIEFSEETLGSLDVILWELWGQYGVLYYCEMLTKNEKVMNVGGSPFQNLKW